MFTLKIDMTLNYADHLGHLGALGKVDLCRTTQFSFAPHSGLRLNSDKFDEWIGSNFPELDNVKWDMDHGVFTANLHMTSGAKLDSVVFDLQTWIEAGWRLGTCDEWYGDELDDAAPEGELIKADLQKAPSDRPPSDISLVRLAMIRNMVIHYHPDTVDHDCRTSFASAAEQHYQAAIAYAMDQTRLCPTADELHAYSLDQNHPWPRAIRDYFDLSSESKTTWADNVERTYPTLAELVARV